MSSFRILCIGVFISCAISLQIAHASTTEFGTLDSLFGLYINSDLDSAAHILHLLEEQERNSEEEIELLLNKSLYHSRTGQFDLALGFNQQAINQCKKGNGKVSAMRIRATILISLGKMDSAYVYLQRCIRAFDNTSAKDRALVYNNIANAAFRLGKTDSARVYIDLSTKMLVGDEKQGSIRIQAGNMSFLAKLFLYHSQYDSSFTYALKSLQLYSQVGNVRGEARGNGQVAGLFLFQEKYKQAIPYFRAAIRLATEIDDARLVATNYSNMGNAYLSLEELDSAQFCFDEALVFAHTVNDPRFLANTLASKGMAFLEQTSIDSAYHYLTQAEEIFRSGSDSYGLSLALSALSELYSIRGQNNLALKSGREALKLATQMKIPELEKGAFEGMFSIFKQQNQSDSALHYFQLFVEVKDSIQAENIRKEIEVLNLQYGTRLRKEENSRLNAELIVSKGRGRQNLILFIGSLVIGILLILSLSTVFYFRNQAKKEELTAQEALLREEQSKTQLMNFKLSKAQEMITVKNQLLQDLENDLRNEVGFAELAEKLLNRINTNKDWAQFMIEFELVFKGFFERLKPGVKKLTKNDLRLACLVRLNLSNKEIADVINISNEGVKKAKNRLKKKLDLGPLKKLDVFIAGI